MWESPLKGRNQLRKHNELIASVEYDQIRIAWNAVQIGHIVHVGNMEDVPLLRCGVVGSFVPRRSRLRKNEWRACDY
jgi:hypothetical protein